MENGLEVDKFKTHGWNVIDLASDENLTITGEFCHCASLALLSHFLIQAKPCIWLSMTREEAMRRP